MEPLYGVATRRRLKTIEAGWLARSGEAMCARRVLSDPLARTSYGWQDGTWSLPWAAKCSMKTSRPVDARLLADGEDPGLQSELGGEYTRPTGGCHEHAARLVLL